MGPRSLGIDSVGTACSLGTVTLWHMEKVKTIKDEMCQLLAEKLMVTRVDKTNKSKEQKANNETTLCKNCRLLEDELTEL